MKIKIKKIRRSIKKILYGKHYWSCDEKAYFINPVEGEPEMCTVTDGESFIAKFLTPRIFDLKPKFCITNYFVFETEVDAESAIREYIFINRMDHILSLRNRISNSYRKERKVPPYKYH